MNRFPIRVPRNVSEHLDRLRAQRERFARLMPERVTRLVPKNFSTVSLLLIVAGAILLGYVCVEYYTMYSSQRQLAREWQEQQERAAQSQAQAQKEGAAEVKPASDGLTRISIPKINLTAVVVEGTNRKQLLLGPGHVKETAKPGEQGNSVITAHRDTFFRHIYELGKGDVVTVERDGKAFQYKVVAKRIVDPSDVSVLKNSDDAQLTLITCYPTYYIGPAPERLVVVSKRVDDSAVQAKAGAGE